MDNCWYLLTDFAIILILIVGIWQFRTVKGARSGNLTAAFALLCALGVVLYRHPVLEPAAVILALVLGGLVGWVVAMRVGMIQIPAMVAFQNGAGSLAAFLVSFVQLTREAAPQETIAKVAGVVSLVIGMATFSGSMIASAKLANCMKQTPTVFPKHDWMLLGIVLVIVTLGIVAGGTAAPALPCSLMVLILASILLGVVFSIRIGGADMPVLISFLNATSGLAAAFCGIIIENRLLIACGATVAASGSILTHVMCKAMNRNLPKVFLGVHWKPGAVPVQAAEAQARKGEPEPSPTVTVEEPRKFEKSQQQAPLAQAIDAAKNANSVVIIPGYGMALAHAQFETVQLANRLEEMGKQVKFAIHPIAGRMPGHMHVLLAEAEVDPDMLFDMDQINPEFQQTDLALIVGACDVVNPAAIGAEDTPIAGMPILAAHDAKQVLVCNLDGQPGYSGVENPLYQEPKTILMFGDAKTSINRLLQGLH